MSPYWARPGICQQVVLYALLYASSIYAQHYWAGDDYNRPDVRERRWERQEENRWQEQKWRWQQEDRQRWMENLWRK
jgi:hypothetical protein